ncbi:MAG: hypothetical protein KDC48_09765, partial [Planctomycetes bacterium]|nr:hypothetical protein [Planctomycetota bacterium]
PRFLEHGHQCRLLEQDMAVVQGQAASIASMQESLAQRWLPLGSSDVLVLAYRRWLERFDHERSDFVGLQRRGPDSHRPQENVTPDRFWLHVRHCASCRAAMSAARWARALGLAGTLVLIALAAVTSGGWRYALAGTGVLAAMLVASADLLLCRLAGRRASLFQDPCQDLVR